MTPGKRRGRRKLRPTQPSGAASWKRAASAPKGNSRFQDRNTADSTDANEIRSLISKGEVKSAVYRAKQMHKARGTEASEALLVEAYRARLLEMIEKGLTCEAEALLSLVRERYHLPDPWLAEIRAAGAAREGIGEAFLAPLNDPATRRETQAAIFKQIKEKIVDLDVLTSSSALSSDYPLKVQAAAIVRAFEAVTSGPVGEADIALSEVPRRSPLAPWKVLIKALSCFYRREDDLCERHLQAVEPDSAPARLVPVVRAMLWGRSRANLSESAQALIEQVTGNRMEIRKIFDELETAMKGGRPQVILQSIRKAVSVCSRYAPELSERLKQHISVRAWILGLEDKAIKKAIGGPSLKNAYFWRLLAQAAELKGETFYACAMWNEFMKHAVHEGLWPKDGLERSVVYLHMADFLFQAADPEFTWERSLFEAKYRRSGGLSGFYKDQPSGIVDAVRSTPRSYSTLEFLYPEHLYRRACEITPAPEAFSNWMEWLKKQNAGRKELDDVAAAWHRVLPHDIRPLLILARSAEKRSAFKKCLFYLEEAEKMDGLNSEIKRIRIRLMAATAIRHLRQKKTHLARKDLKTMTDLPLFGEGDRGAFVTGLRWVCAVIEEDKAALGSSEKELIRLMGSPFAASLMLRELLEACGLSRNLKGPLLSAGKALTDGGLLLAVGRCCLLGDDVGVPFVIPDAYVSELESVFRSNSIGLSNGRIMAIGNAALRQGARKLAYAVSVAGLKKRDAGCARFLLIRARSLPPWEGSRKNACIEAAIGFARKERDMELIDECIELKRSLNDPILMLPPFERRMGGRDLSTDEKAIHEALAREREACDYPDRKSDSYLGDVEEDDAFDINDCRRCDVRNCDRRSAPYDPELDDDWEDKDLDVDDLELLDILLEDGRLDIPPDIPPEALSILLKVYQKHGHRKGRLPGPEELLRNEPELAHSLFSILLEQEANRQFDEYGFNRSSSRGRGRGKKRSKKKGRR